MCKTEKSRTFSPSFAYLFFLIGPIKLVQQKEGWWNPFCAMGRLHAQPGDRNQTLKREGLLGDHKVPHKTSYIAKWYE